MAESGNHTPTIQGYLEPAGYVQITDVSAATGIGTVPNQAKLVMIQAEAQNVRWRDDGEDPEAGVGTQLAAGDTLVYTGKFSEIKFIEEAGGAILNLSFYK